MATALEVLPLARAKQELAVAASVTDHDQLLLDQIASSVDFAAKISGLDIEALAVADIPPSFTQACVALVRLLYDGFVDWRPLNSIWALLAVHRTLAVGISLDGEDET